jgi:hypothetical protein
MVGVAATAAWTGAAKAAGAALVTIWSCAQHTFMWLARGDICHMQCIHMQVFLQHLFH